MIEATIEITPLRFGAIMISDQVLHVLSERGVATRVSLPSGFTQGHVVNALADLRGYTCIVIITDGDEPPRYFWNGQRYTTLNTEVIGSQLSTKITHLSVAKAIAVYLRHLYDEASPEEAGVILLNDAEEGNGGSVRWYHANSSRFEPVPVQYMGNIVPGPLEFLLPKPLTRTWLIAGGIIQAMLLRYPQVGHIGVWSSSPFEQAHFGPDGSFWPYLQSEGYNSSIAVVDNVGDLLRAGVWLAPRAHISQFVA